MVRRMDVPTDHGPVSVLWKMSGDAPRVLRVFLSSEREVSTAAAARLFPEAPVSRNSTTDYISEKISALFRGEKVFIPLYMVDLDVCTVFQRRVLSLEHSVPRGRVTTYGAIAKALGCPGATRAVGGALARNPFPLIVPCHRTVRADMSPGGFQGGTEMKRYLLESEGVEFDHCGRVHGCLHHFSGDFS